jgi:hypothetical protein
LRFSVEINSHRLTHGFWNKVQLCAQLTQSLQLVTAVNFDNKFLRMTQNDTGEKFCLLQLLFVDEIIDLHCC